MSCAVHPAGTTTEREAMRLPLHGRASHLRFLGVSALLFVACTTATVVWCTSMTTTCCGTADCPLTSMWRPSPWETWTGTVLSFLGMWVVMMLAMMLPSLTPTLGRYRRALGPIGEWRQAGLTLVVALGYVLVWAAVGLIAFALGAALSALIQAEPALRHAMPLAAGVVVLGAGLLQGTAWKARHLASCRSATAPATAMSGNVCASWRHGLQLGIHCSCACLGLTAILLASGMMDLLAMALVTLAITAERLAPASERVAHAIGVVAGGAGLFLIVQAIVPR